MINSFFKDGKFIKNSTRSKNLDTFFDELKVQFNLQTNNKSQLLWHFKNEISEIPTCLSCGKQVKFKNINHGYQEYCSKTCMHGSDIVKTKRINSIMGSLNSKFGVDNVMKIPEIRKKHEETCFEKYGYRYPLQVEEFKQKSKNTLMTNLGVEHPTQSKEVIEKIKTTCLNLGRSSPRDFTQNRTNRIALVIEWCDKFNITYGEFDNTKNLKDEIYHFSHTCGNVWKQTIDKFPLCPVCHTGSKLETDIKHWLSTILSSDEIISNDRMIISPLEIDILIPRNKVGIEMNGLYWHCDESNKVPIFKKTDLCFEKGISLISIWEHEWYNEKSKEIIKNIIKSKLGIFGLKIGARKCVLKINHCRREIIEFLNNNHLNGNSQFSNSISLHYNNKIVSVITLSHYRYGKERSDIELIRFCSEPGVQIQGGLSRMLSKVKILFPESNKLISYCDRRFGDGKGYLSCGMKYISTTKPNYIWWKDDIFLKRWNTNKNALKSLLQEKFDNSLSENELMKNNGWRKLSDAGNLKFELILNN